MWLSTHGTASSTCRQVHSDYRCLILLANVNTGNTIFAALGLGGQPQATHNQQYYKSLTAIGAFCLGTLFFSALHRYPTGFRNQPSSRRRGILILSFAIQTVFIIVPAILVTIHAVSNLPFMAGEFSSGSNNNTPRVVNYLDICPVAILSFQAAGQVTLSRILGLLELPTIVLSALFHDFTADLYSLHESWQKRSGLLDFVAVHQRRQGKRLASIIALFIGGFVGGELYKSEIGMAGALWISAGLKFAITLSWCFWKKEKDTADDSSEDNDRLPR